MTLTMDQMGQNPALERFLRATVGPDANGINVTVISMLARLEIDPWAEASDLAAMPPEPARKRLIALMTRFKDVPMLSRDQTRSVSALLDLLPAKKAAAEQGMVVPAIGMPTYLIIIAFLILAWVFSLSQGN